MAGELDGDGAQALIDAFDPCGVDLFAELGSSLTMGLTEEQQACAAENIDHDLATALLRTAFSTTEGTVPHTLARSRLDHSSASSAIGEDGVMG